MNAAFIARYQVVWFAPLWVSGYTFLRLEHSFLVRVGDYCEIRALQFLRPNLPVGFQPNPTHFTHGPAVRYNKWLRQPNMLPFKDPEKTAPEISPDPEKQTSAQP